MRPGITFLCMGTVRKGDTVMVFDGTFAGPATRKIIVIGAKYVYGIALMDAKAFDFITVDVGDALDRDKLCKTLDGAEAELRDLMKKVEHGD